MSTSYFRFLLASASVSVLLAACGGGGGPDAPPAAPAPAPAPSPVTITAAPSDVTVEETESATFTIGVSTLLPFSVEWSRNGVVVASRGGTTFVVPSVTLADDGAVFSARVNAGVNNATGPSTTTSVAAGSATLRVNIASPAAPTGVSILPGSSGTAALLRWTDNAGNETGFEILRVVNGQDVVVDTTPANQVSRTVTGLTPGARETLRVRAIRSVSGRTATSAVASASATMPGGVADVPVAPDNARLTVVAGTPTAVDLAWDDNSDNEGGFEVVQVVNGNDVTIGVANPDQTQLRISGLAGGSTHTFRVRAFRSTAAGIVRSAFASATITLPNASAQTLTLNPAQDNVVRVSTVDPAVANQVLRNVAVEVGCTYIIDFGAAGNGAVCSRSLVLFDVAQVSGRTIRRAELRLMPVGGGVTFAPVRDMMIGAVEQAWNPATVNGNNALTLDAIGVVTAPLSTLGVERVFDVTTIVARWASGAQPNNGFGLSLSNESIPGNVPTGAYAMFNSFGSRENSIVANRPELFIEFE